MRDLALTTFVRKHLVAERPAPVKTSGFMGFVRTRLLNSPTNILLTILGALLISGMAVQMAAASDHRHHVTKANFARHHAEFRGAYNQMRPVNARVAPPVGDAGSRGFDPSWIGDRDPSLNPAD